MPKKYNEKTLKGAEILYKETGSLRRVAHILGVSRSTVVNWRDIGWKYTAKKVKPTLTNKNKKTLDRQI